MMVGFQVPEDAELAELYWQSESGHLAEVMAFGAGDDVGMPKLSSSADPATPAD